MKVWEPLHWKNISS